MAWGTRGRVRTGSAASLPMLKIRSLFSFPSPTARTPYKSKVAEGYLRCKQCGKQNESDREVCGFCKSNNWR